MKALVKSECINRTSGARAFVGEVIEVSPEEYERLKIAGCIKDLQTETASQPETASLHNPRGRRAKGR